MIKTFKLWVEELEARKTGFQDIIIGFLKNELKINDDDIILDMNTKQIDQSVISKLLDRGIVRTANPDVLTRIKDGVSIRELVSILAGGEEMEKPTISTKQASMSV
jgi:hypothetical protein